jgi:hypothetical protein
VKTPALIRFRRVTQRRPVARNRWFESISLQRGVLCELTFSLGFIGSGGIAGMGMLCGVRPVEYLIQLEQAAASDYAAASRALQGYYRGSRQ